MGRHRVGWGGAQGGVGWGTGGEKDEEEEK